MERGGGKRRGWVGGWMRGLGVCGVNLWNGPVLAGLGRTRMRRDLCLLRGELEKGEGGRRGGWRWEIARRRRKMRGRLRIEMKMKNEKRWSPWGLALSIEGN